MTPEDVRAVAQELRDYATHFEARDWRYTRDLDGLVEIRYDRPHNRLRYRVRRALRILLSGAPPWAASRRWGLALAALARDKGLPDGILDGGCVITHWEETGEYLQYVQPTVGAMIAEWLAAEPDNPHAVRIATEMRRIQDDYAARLGGQG